MKVIPTAARCKVFGLLFAVTAILFHTTTLPADDFKELDVARREYKKTSPHGNENARVRYVNKLAELLEGFIGEHIADGSDRNAWKIKSIHNELRRHPAPKNSDSKALSKTLVGKWQSPRHEYQFHSDGRWFMLPVEKNSTRGLWRIEGNRYFDITPTEPGSNSQYTIILLNSDYFVFTDSKHVFIESRIKR